MNSALRPSLGSLIDIGIGIRKGLPLIDADERGWEKQNSPLIGTDDTDRGKSPHSPPASAAASSQSKGDTLPANDHLNS